MLTLLVGALVGPGIVSAAAGAKTLAAIHTAANAVTFQASMPDDPAAPAITTVAVSNDDNGLVTFQVNLANRPQITNNDHYAVFLSTDSNPNTGDKGAEGADYAVLVDNGRADLGHWTGSDYDFGVPQASLVFNYANGPVVKISAGELGGTTGFDFFVAALTDDPAGGSPHADFAPPAGHGTWSYQVKIAQLALSFVKLTTTPTTAKAGQAFTASMAISANRPDAIVQGVQVVCTATIAGHPVRARLQGFANDIARCAWQLPRSAKGKKINGSVGVTYQGLRVSHPFSRRIG